ncbi:MFS transporter, partial [Klebsiella pneumoniae]
VVGIAIGLGMPLLSVILESRGHSASMIGLNTAVAGLASIAGAPLATPIATRLGVAWTMLIMIAAGALAFVGFHFATAFWMWFPLRVVLH